RRGRQAQLAPGPAPAHSPEDRTRPAACTRIGASRPPGKRRYSRPPPCAIRLGGRRASPPPGMDPPPRWPVSPLRSAAVEVGDIHQLDDNDVNNRSLFGFVLVLLFTRPEEHRCRWHSSPR